MIPLVHQVVAVRFWASAVFRVAGLVLLLVLAWVITTRLNYVVLLPLTGNLVGTLDLILAWSDAAIAAPASAFLCFPDRIASWILPLRRGAVRCARCKHDLAGAVGHRCSECGLAHPAAYFDEDAAKPKPPDPD
ncbi:MAG: hypothetical protein AAGI17_04270 [Planctomycetota bacterium]